MKNLNKIAKFCTPILALMVLVSSLSYTIDFHYCQGQLKSFSLIGKAKNCHEMANKMASCKHHQQKADSSPACNEADSNCCSNKTVFIESEFDEKIPNIVFTNLNHPYFVVAQQHSSFDDLFQTIKEVVPYAHYKPPLIQKDLPVLFESFLL